MTVRVDDTGEETRWPQWLAAIAELDLRAMLSVPLVTIAVMMPPAVRVPSLIGMRGIR